jgi:hypothetical protein
MMRPRHSVKSSNCFSILNSSFNKYSTIGEPPALLNATRLKGLKQSLEDLDKFIEIGKIQKSKTLIDAPD